MKVNELHQIEDVNYYQFINWLPGPYWKILSLKSYSRDQTKWDPCDVTEGLVFLSTDLVTSNK